MSVFEDVKEYLNKSTENCIDFDTKIKRSRIPTFVFRHNNSWILVAMGGDEEIYKKSDREEVLEMLRKFSWQKSTIEDIDKSVNKEKIKNAVN